MRALLLLTHKLFRNCLNSKSPYRDVRSQSNSRQQLDVLVEIYEVMANQIS